MKKTILNLIIIVLAFVILIGTISFAGNPFSVYSGISASNPEVEKIGGRVIGIINVAGTVIAIVMLLFVGMKFMLAAPDEKANLKSTLTIYIVGAIILFASTSLVSIIYRFSQRI